MATKETIKTFCKSARPVMSINATEAKTRVRALYKAFYRYIPYIKNKIMKLPHLRIEEEKRLVSKFCGIILPGLIKVKYFDIPKNEQDCRCKLREEFYKNACVTDIRVIDILVIKGFMELKELTHNWQQKGHVIAHWNPSAEPKPTTFIGKFLAGVD